MNVCSIWPFEQICDDFYYLDIWQRARQFVAASFKELALITIKEMWGLESRSRSRTSRSRSRSRSPLLWQVSVSSRNLSQVSVSVSEVTVSTTSLISSNYFCWTSMFAYFVEFKTFTITVPVFPLNWIFLYVFHFHTNL